MGAENRDVAPDQLVRGQSTDLAVTFHCPHSMISRRGLPTRLPDARPRRHSQERGEPGTPTRDRRATSTQPAPGNDLGRPCPAQHAQPAPAGQSAPVAARLTENAAALARPAGRPALDVRDDNRAVHPSRNPSGRWCCGWPRRTRDGATAASRASWSDSAIRLSRRRCGRSSTPRASTPPRGSPDRSGDSSWPRRPTRSSTRRLRRARPGRPTGSDRLQSGARHRSDRQHTSASTAGTAGTVQINHTLIRIRGVGLLRKSTKSSAGVRALLLPDFALSMLRRRKLAAAVAARSSPIPRAAGAIRPTRAGTCATRVAQRSSPG